MCDIASHGKGHKSAKDWMGKIKSWCAKCQQPVCRKHTVTVCESWTLALFQNDSCVMYLKDIIFERSLFILLFEKSYILWEKMYLSLLVTPILPVSSPLLPITLTLDCRQCTEMLIFSIFQREQCSAIFVFQNWEHKEKKRKIKNLTQIQCIVVQYSDPNF